MRTFLSAPAAVIEEPMDPAEVLQEAEVHEDAVSPKEQPGIDEGEA